MRVSPHLKTIGLTPPASGSPLAGVEVVPAGCFPATGRQLASVPPGHGQLLCLVSFLVDQGQWLSETLRGVSEGMSEAAWAMWEEPSLLCLAGPWSASASVGSSH